MSTPTLDPQTTTETAGGQRHHEAEKLAAGGGGPSPGRFPLICHHPEGRGVTTTYWDSREEAGQALAELTPCGRRCGGAHTIVDRDPPPSPHHPAALGLPRDPRIINGDNAS